MTPREESVLQQVIEQVEPLTRFDRSSFGPVKTTTDLVAVAAQQYCGITIHVDTESGKGELPRGTVALADARAMRLHCEQAKAAAYQALPARLQRWLDAQPSQIQSDVRLRPSHCFDIPDPVGYDYSCSTCGGAGTVGCGTCHRSRREDCPKCKRSGTQPCENCDNGRVICRPCNGRGRWTETRTRVSTSGTHGDQITIEETYLETVICTSCGGWGSFTCGVCNGSGSITCKTCNGAKEIGCRTCNARGVLGCSACDATGWRYERASLRATVNTYFVAQASQASAEMQGLLEKMRGESGLSALLAMARGVTCTEERLTADTVTRDFVAMVDVTTLFLQAHDGTFDISGYGDPPRIFDFKNVIGRLLQGDLDTLEALLRSSPKYLPWQNARLQNALAAFLQSEINARIAGRARDFRGTVSADYVARAAKAIRAGIERAYWGEILPQSLYLLILPIGILVEADLRHWITFGPIPALIVGAIAFACALLLEWLGKQNLNRRFRPVLGENQEAVLEDLGILPKGRRLLRGSAIVGAILGWIGGAMVLAFLFTHRPLHTMPASHPATKHPQAKPAKHKKWHS